MSQSASRLPFGRSRQRRGADAPALGLDGALHELAAAVALRNVQEMEAEAIPSARARSSTERMRNLLFAADALAFVLAIVVVEATAVHFRQHDLMFFSLAGPALCLWALVARTYGLYDRQGSGPDRTIADDVPDLLLLTSVAAWFGTLFVNLADLAHPRPRVIVTFWLALLVAMVLTRAAVRLLGHYRSRSSRRTLIVGAGRAGRSLHRELRETPGERVVGFLDDNPHLRRRRLQGAPVLGALAELERVVERGRVDRVVVTIPDAPRDRLDAVVDACLAAGADCRFVRREIDLDPHVVLGAAAE